ncbi:MAG TPA: hypothetical protein VFJ82_01105 [Longimicrobium sp.]|nr:hypothetical protein [Longimicrobium sp.]
MSTTPRQWVADPEKWLQLLTLVGGLAAFAIGLHEYRQEQRWRRLEYFTQLLESVEGEPEVRRALAMLEYNQPRVCAPADAGDTPRCFVATDSLLTAALDGSIHQRVLTADEHQVIVSIDRLLTALDRLEYLQEQGMVDEEVRHPTVAYWISLIGDRRNRAKPAPMRAKLCEYVRYYEYKGTLKFVARYTPPRERIPQCTVPDSP